MSEIDPVILELIAKDGEYRARVTGTANIADRAFVKQEKGAKRLEAQMRKSSLAISTSIIGISAALGAAFSGRQLASILDSYTRIQNSLRVAGVEGSALKVTQDRLLASAQKYGVELEGLAGLYSTTSQAAKEFGAAQSDVFKVTDAVSATLKITGQSSQQASGALLQLGQAFRSPKVQAEEFNSLIDGMYPLLEAAAAGSARWGGSVTKLIADVKKGTVTGQEFFNAVAAGSAMLEQRAAKATLTLAAGFTTLSNAVTVYFGEADKANGVSAALGLALQAVAQNIDTLIPALAVIATALGVGLVTNAIAARVALLGASGAAVTLAGTATAAGRALLAAFGGTIGIAITALAVGIGYLAANTEEAARAAREAENQSARTAAALDSEKRVTDALAEAKGRERDATIESIKASRDRAVQARQTAAELIKEARASLAAARAGAQEIYSKSAGDTGFLATLGRGLGGVPTMTPGTGKANQIGVTISDAEKKLHDAEKRFAILEGEIDGIANGLGENNVPGLPTVTGAGSTKKGPRSRGGSGPTADEIEQRFNDELIGYAQQALSARQSMATSAEERADLESTGVELARRQTLNSIDADKNYSAGQKKILKEQVDHLANLELERVEQDKRLQLFQEATDLAEARNRAEQDALRDQFDLATTDDDRRRIALRILDAEDAYLRSKLEAVVANQDLADAVRKQAQIELDALNSSAPTRRAVVEKANQGALDRYIDDISDTKKRTEEAMVRQLQEVNDGITDALTKQLGIKNQFVKDMFSIFLDEVIFKPLAESLREGSSGGNPIGAFFSSIFGSIFGRASGGYAAPGSIHRVNEHAGGVELLRMGSQGGQVIPLGQVNTSASRSGGQTVIQQTVNVDARGVNPKGFADHIVGEVRKETISIVAQASNATLKAMPGKMASYQQDGTL